MTKMFSKIFKERYYSEIQNILKKRVVPTKQQIEKVLEKEKLDLDDIYLLVQTYDNPELRNLVIKTAIKKRETIWKNRLFLVPPLYVTDRCINDCFYCPWRKSSPMQRRALSKEELKKEIDFLINQGYRTIEIVGASDPTFTAEKIAEFINITKKKLNEVGGGKIGLNFESALKKDYKRFVKVGLHFMVLWQETYHPETYKKLHPKNTQKANMDYRLDAFDRAIQGGLKRVSIAFLGRLYDWKFEVLALFTHGSYLEKTYGIPPFIIGTPRWNYAQGCKIKKAPYEYSDEAFLLVAAIYKLAFPKSLPWFSTREKFELSKKSARGGGALFTLDCSTTVGGYTLRKDFPQFPVYSKDLSQGKEWLKSLDYKPEVHLPY